MVNLRGSNLAALITATVTAAAFVFGIIQYYTDMRFNNQVQEESYKSLKQGFEDFSRDVTRDIGKMNDTMNDLRIQLAVAQEAIKNLRHRGELTERTLESTPHKMVTRAMSLPDFESVKEMAQTQIAAPISTPASSPE